MNSSSSQHKDSENSLWEWISTGEFRLPPVSIQTSFKTRLMSLLHPRKPSENMDDVLKPESLEFLSAYLLDRLVPLVDWENHASSLDSALMPWCEAPEKNFILILNVPHSGNAEVLKCWAASHNFKMIEPPRPSDILKSNDAWFKQFENNDSCWVLSGLERCWLRHEDGLFLIRKFFRRLFAGELGFGVVGCGSWAWSYFRYALGISAPVSIVTKPFDSEKLRRWLGALAFEKSSRRVRFRQADNGRFVLSSEANDREMTENKQEQSPFLRDLAAFSYGISGVVLAYWRSSLQAEPDTLNLEKKKDDASVGHSTGHSTVWVKPWLSIEKPDLPKEAGRNHAFILHSLLLHDTLEMDMLSKLLPIGPPHLDQAIYDLSHAGLIESSENQWQVSPKGYPVVRGFLRNEGLLTDDFR